MWLIFSIATVLLWGTSDVIFKSSSGDDDDSVKKLLAYNGMILGTFSLLYMLFNMVFYDYVLQFNIFIKYLPIAVIYITSMFFYYKALPLIKISLASPIANSSCLLTTILCVVFLKQELLWYQIIGIGLIVIPIILLSTDRKELKTMGKINKGFFMGIIFALGYFVLDAVGSFLDDYTLDEVMGEVDVLVAYGVIYMIVGIVCYIMLKGKDRTYRFNSDKKKLIGSLIETAGQFTYIYAFAFGQAAIASPFIASFCAVSIILSRIFLKEKLRPFQYVLIVFMIAGMVLLAIE